MSTQYAVDLFFRPRLAFGALLNEPQRVGYGILDNLVFAVVYFIGIIIALETNVMHAPQLLVLNIPLEQYYTYERLFKFPLGLAGTMLASGVIRLGAREWKGEGLFKDLTTLLGFGSVVLAVVIGLPDLLIGILTGFGAIAPQGFTYVEPHVWMGTL